MPLPSQLVHISTQQGVDTKTDEKLVVEGKLIELENGVFDKGGTIKKRNGYTVFAQDIAGGGALSAADRLGKFKDELLLFDDNTAYTYSAVQDEWTSKGRVSDVDVTFDPIFRGERKQTESDMASLGGYEVYAWVDSVGDIRANVVETSSGAFQQYDVVIDASGTADRPRCVALASVIVIVWMDGNNLIAKTFTPSTNTFSAPTTLRTDANTTHRFDIEEVEGDFVVLYNDTTAAQSTIIKVDSSLTVTVGPTTFAHAATRCCSVIFRHDSIFTATNDGTDTQCTIRNKTTLADTGAGLTVLATNNLSQITGTDDPDTTSGVVFYMHILTGGPSDGDDYIEANTITTAASVGTTKVVIRYSCLAHHAFTREGKPYVGILYSGFEDSGSLPLQPTYFLIQDDTGETAPTARIAAKILPGRAINHGADGSDGHIPSIVNPSADEYVWAPLYRERFSASDVSDTGVGRSAYSFNAADRFASVEMGENLHVSGGEMQLYDGSAMFENGFHIFPEEVAASMGTTGGSITTAGGTFGIAVIYKWVDAQGQYHRSAPYFNTVSAAAGSNRRVNFTSIPTLKHTNKDDVFIDVFMTLEDGAIYYKASDDDPTGAKHISNDPSVDDITTFTIDALPATTNEILYTQGGILENSGPPPCSVLGVGKNRVYLVDSEDRNLIWFSKRQEASKGTEFSDLLTVRIQPEGGDITAIAELDDKVIAFKRDNVYVFFGDGPNAAGVGSFSPVQQITSDVGCIDQRTVVKTDLGIMFKSTKGIYLLSRNLQVSYIGADVEGFNSLTTTSATLLEDVDQVRFTHSDGVTLVYDYHFRQWSTFTNMTANDGVKYGGLFHFLRSNGEVRKEAVGTFQDDGTNIVLKLVTAWIKTAGLEGFKRVRWFRLLGTYVSSHNLTVDIAYDYDATVVDTITWTPGASEPYRLRSRLSKQKCTSLRFTIADNTGTGASYELNSLALEVAFKKGGKPLGASRTQAAT